MQLRLIPLLLLAAATPLRAQQPDPQPLDLSHVQVGQTYDWRLPNGVAQRWTVTEVGADAVGYTVRTTLDVGEGPQPVGEPQAQRWRSGELRASMLPPKPAEGQAQLPRETVVISGHRFECLVAVAGSMNAVTWVPVQGERPVFPPLVKSTLDGELAMELVAITPRGPLADTEDRAPGKPPQPERPVYTGDGADLSHVKAGQVYVYGMLNDMRGEWEVLEVQPNRVRYQMTITMDLGQGPQPVGEPQEQIWEYQAQVGIDRARQQPGVKTRRETRTVSGVRFDCLVIESNGWTSWITMTPGSESITTFPGLVESSDGEGRSSMKLLEVRQP